VPARVASLTLISAIGVQELELLGDYYLNRGLHAVQLLALSVLQEGTPHMGPFDRLPLNRFYARNFFDADQRPLRAIMQTLPVPPIGAVIPLVEVGTHARGALFLDARRLITPAMTQAFEKISRSFAGFYFGRYDVRVPSVEDFQAGRNIRVLELNGVTSEATHVYDPHYRLLDAWRDLMHQWRIAFEISARNQVRGIQPILIRTFFRLVFGNSAPPA
jgi:hypothetical protein